MSRKYVIIPILACVYAEIVSPLLLHIDTGPLIGGAWNAVQQQIMAAPRLDNRIFWPAATAITLILTLRNWSRLTLPPHIVCLFVYLAFAGLSVIWAFKSDVSLIRFLQQAMIILSLVLPALLAPRTADMMQGVFLCFVCASIINVFFVLNQNPLILENGRMCYAGYFTFKGILGECAAYTLLLALYEVRHRGGRRLLGIFAIGISLYLINSSDSKGSLALALPAPILAALTVMITKKMRISPALVVLPIPIFYTVLSFVVSGLLSRISYHLYGNYTLSGRTVIWDFANFEIARRPVLGWGYQSFWHVGADGPSLTDAPGWVKDMPCAHSGYLDTMIEMGYVGLILLIIFIFTTLHAMGRVVHRDPGRAWQLLTIAFYIICTNFIESGWMRSSDLLWVLFVIVAAEAGRYWQPNPAKMPEPLPRVAAPAGLHPGLTRMQAVNKLNHIQKRPM